MKKLKIVFEEKHFTTKSIVVVVVHVKQEVKILLAPPGIQTSSCIVCRFFEIRNLTIHSNFFIYFYLELKQQTILQVIISSNVTFPIVYLVSG
jgi:hypothetical protein